MENYLQNWENIFNAHRPFLLSLSFRLTGSLSESEDIIQDTFIACAKTNPENINNHFAWLTKVAANKALDHLKLAHKKREVYVGVWLPDSVPDSFMFWDQLKDVVSPATSLFQKESLTTSFLLLLQNLNAEERVVFVLADVFAWSFKDIADILGKSEESCKKTAQRARKYIAESRRFNDHGLEAQKIVRHFFDVAKTGDVSSLEKLLAKDSEFRPDSGGKVQSASTEVILDPALIAKFIAKIWTSERFQTLRQEFHLINNRPGLIVSGKSVNGDWRIETIASIEVEGGKIVRIYSQRNPDKLSTLSHYPQMTLSY